jgi:hypothetical protein
MAQSLGRRLQLASRLMSLALAWGLVLAVPAGAFEEQLADQARSTLREAAAYFATTLSVKGSFVWEYSEDLSVRKGEGLASPTMGWVQPPGTPSVGAAFLRIYEATGEQQWLEAAKTSARALVETQLVSGGWYYSLELDRAVRKQWCYRTDGMTSETCKAIEGNRLKNRTMLDDDTTQSALLFLIWLDKIAGAKDQSVRDAILYGLDRLSDAQYANGAWPVVTEKHRKEKATQPGLKGKLPASWSHEWVKPSEGPYYVLNDNIVRDLIHVYLVAADQFGNKAFLDAAVRAGDFLVNAQLPEPQRGWAQAYDITMTPVWGRKFEPPAVASRETAGAVASLIELYRRTGEARFLNSARDGAAWLRSVQLPDGDWARFYELSTNRPLYVDNDEKLTYEPENLLDHYNLKSRYDIPQVLAWADAADPQDLFPLWPSSADGMSQEEVEQRVRELVASADASGRWIEDGWVRSKTFVEAAFVIARYLGR